MWMYSGSPIPALDPVFGLVQIMQYPPDRVKVAREEKKRRRCVVRRASCVVSVFRKLHSRTRRVRGDVRPVVVPEQETRLNPDAGIRG
jgi:hypothetical protein